jgi:hypothetical protein
LYPFGSYRGSGGPARTGNDKRKIKMALMEKERKKPEKGMKMESGLIFIRFTLNLFPFAVMVGAPLII